jgi:hypothetical protein
MTCLRRQNAHWANDGQRFRVVASKHRAATTVGAKNWALLASIVATCKLSDVNPVAYIADTLEAILNGHPQSRIEDLMPWRFRKTSSPDA